MAAGLKPTQIKAQKRSIIATNMAYDEKLAQRVRTIVAEHQGVTEKPLMGTLAFMVNGTMCCSVGRDGLLVRVDADDRARLLAAATNAFVTPMRLGGRTMRGFVRVASEGLRTRAKLAQWIGRGMAAGAAIARKRRSRRAARSLVGGRGSK